MKHTSIGQASPDIAPEGVFKTMAGRIFEGKGASRGLDVSTCPQLGRIMPSGGGYGKCLFNKAQRRYMMELRVKAKIYYALFFANLIIMTIFHFSGINIGFYITMIIACILVYPMIKAGNPFMPKDEKNLLYENEEGALYEYEEDFSYKDKESLLYRYVRFIHRHYIILPFIIAQLIFVIATVAIVASGKFQWATYLIIFFAIQGAVAVGLFLSKYLTDKGII